MLLDRRKKYLQIAFNRSLTEVQRMVSALPVSDRIIVEAGTPFMKEYGSQGIAMLHQWWSERLGHPGYVVADMKCMDRGTTEVLVAARAGASAVTCLGLAPLETIREFIERCQAAGVDSMIDMLNVEFPIEILQYLRKQPDVVVLHRGVDEASDNRERMLPHHLINRIKATYPVLISLAGGETVREGQRTIFNGADITVMWRLIYDSPESTAQLAGQFLSMVT